MSVADCEDCRHWHKEYKHYQEMAAHWRLEVERLTNPVGPVIELLNSLQVSSPLGLIKVAHELEAWAKRQHEPVSL